MFKYNNGVLEIKKIDVPDLDVNIMDDINDSYKKYLNSTVYDDMEYLAELIRNATAGYDNLGVITKVKPLASRTYSRSQTRNSTHYYPVVVQFTLDGNPVGHEWEVLRVPYMDGYGKLNIDGSSKVAMMVQRSADDISYAMKNNMFNIAMPYANVRIYATAKSIKMAYGKSRINMSDIIMAMLYEAGDPTKLGDIFTNTILAKSMNLDPLIDYAYKSSFLRSNTGSSGSNNSNILSKLQSLQYVLGNTRTALNENLTIDRGIGETLSRPVLNYSAGTVVTKEIIKEFKFNRINCFHVQNFIMPEGYLYAGNTMCFTTIPKGTLNGVLLRKKLPQYANEVCIPEDVELTVDSAIYISQWEELKKEQIEFLVNGGFTSVQVSTGKQKKPFMFSFEREIVGNYFAKLGELVPAGQVPAGRYYDEWVYFFNNPNLEPSSPEHLTCHDLIAIVSVIGQILLTGKSTLLDRDTSFLKKILLVNEIFSETVRKCMADFVKHYHVSIMKAITTADDKSPFWTLTKKWLSFMYKERFLAPADTVNLIAEVSQVNHVVTLLPSTASVADEQRHLAMPFYGRICPYETPAGKKLGIVNTKALCAKVKDGLLLAPYRRVVKTADGIRVSNNIEWLSVKDELGFKFGDILSLKKDANGKYINNRILARVPNPDESDEPFIFRNINAFDLAPGYVSAVPEQFLSPTAGLIPFASSNDPVRISYGLSQIRQAIYLVKSQKPWLQTSLHKDICSYDVAEKFKMPFDGVVEDINELSATLVSKNGKTVTVPFASSNHVGGLSTVTDRLVSPGQHLKAGEVYAEVYKYPQTFVVRAPHDGVVTKITNNGITIDKSGGNSSMPDLDGITVIPIKNGRIAGQSAVFMNLRVSVGDHVRKGTILADTCASRDGIYTPSANPLVAYMCYGYNYEDGVLATEHGSLMYTSIVAHTIKETLPKRHYPYITAKPIQGFRYCNAGDTIGTIARKDKSNSNRVNTKSVKATVKAHGIPFEISTVEDTSSVRTYAYHLLGFNKLQVGDKMAGNHGNKGVVSNILPDSQAPQLLNGLTPDLILNPCGVPSRMNLGQILDCHLSLAAHVLNSYIKCEAFNGASPEDVSYMLRYAWALANTEAIGVPGSGVYNRDAFDAVCSAFSELPLEFHNDVWNNIENILDWRGVFNPDGSAQLYDPTTDSMFEGNVVIGFPNFNKLMQEANEKINARAGLLEEQYARTTSQPQKSPTSAKGQRIAEMELMALAAYGCSSFIDEIMNEKSDNNGRRINNHLRQLGYSERVDEVSSYARSAENLLYLLEACGVKVELPKDVVDISVRATNSKYTLNVPKVINSHSSHSLEKNDNVNDTLADFDDCEA